MDKADVLINVRQYLIDQAVVRDPRVAGLLPACWIMPGAGLNAPGAGNTTTERSDPVVALWGSPGPAPRQGEGFIRQEVVLFEIRTSSDKVRQAFSFEDAVRTVLNDKRGWTMGSVLVNESNLVRDIQQVDFGPAGFTFNFQYNVATWGPFQPAP